MTVAEFNKKQLENMLAILHSDQPENQTERDIYNLKYIRYSIRHGSPWYRYGMIASLDRVIKLLEKGENNG